MKKLKKSGRRARIPKGYVGGGQFYKKGKPLVPLKKKKRYPSGKLGWPPIPKMGSVKLKPSKKRARPGDKPVKLGSKYYPANMGDKWINAWTGEIGEAIAASWLQMKSGRKTFHAGTVASGAKQRTFAADLLNGNYLVEVKTGLASAGYYSYWAQKVGTNTLPRAAKKWSITKKAKAIANEMKRAMTRKKKALASLSKKTGRKLKPMTVALILNPKTRTVDVYRFKGWHERIYWDSPDAKRGYEGSYRY